MNCRTFHRNLEDYLEGGLDFAGRFGMERHAQQCFGCGKVVSDAQKLSQMARELKGVGAPANFEAAILSRIQKEALARPAWKIWRWPVLIYEWPSYRSVAAGAAVATLLCCAIFFSVRWLNPERQAPAAWIAVQSAPSAPAAPDSGSVAGPLPGTEVASASGLAEKLVMIKTPDRRARVGFSTEENKAEVLAEPADTEYVEYLVPGPGDRQYIMRLPKTIRMRYGQPSEEYFIRNVSH